MTFPIIIFLTHQHKAAGRKTRLDIQNYGCNGSLLCDHGVVERNRISSLESHGKTLEKECCLVGVFCNCGDMPVNLIMPCTSCLYGKWVEDVCAGQFGYLSILVCAVFWAAAPGLVHAAHVHPLPYHTHKCVVHRLQNPTCGPLLP